MGQRKNLYVSLGRGPYVACFNTPLHHLSHPTLQEKVDTSAPLSALCLNSPFQCCSWTLGFLLQPILHLYFIFRCKSVSWHSEQTKCRGTLHQGHHKWADPALWALFHFIFTSFFVVFVHRTSFPAYVRFSVTVLSVTALMKDFNEPSQRFDHAGLVLAWYSLSTGDRWRCKRVSSDYCKGDAYLCTACLKSRWGSSRSSSDSPFSFKPPRTLILLFSCLVSRWQMKPQVTGRCLRNSRWRPSTPRSRPRTKSPWTAAPGPAHLPHTSNICSFWGAMFTSVDVGQNSKHLRAFII